LHIIGLYEKNLPNEKSPYQGGRRLWAVGWDGSGRLGRVPVAPLGLTSGGCSGSYLRSGLGSQHLGVVGVFVVTLSLTF